MAKPRAVQPPDAPDRRARVRRDGVRRPASSVPGLSARLIAGREVQLVNVSRRGVLFESTERLVPNAIVRIQFVTGDGRTVIRGRVVRSTVGALSADRLIYRTAVSLDDDIRVCDERLWREDFEPLVQAQGATVGRYLGVVRAFLTLSKA